MRGVLGAILVTALAGIVAGLGWEIGALVGSTAMLGDLFSSFVKRVIEIFIIVGIFFPSTGYSRPALLARFCRVQVV